MKKRIEIIMWMFLGFLTMFGFVITFPLWIITGINTPGLCFDKAYHLIYK